MNRRDISAGQFRDMLKDLLSEAASPEDEQEGDSLDQQVDRYLAQYEGESKTDDSGPSNESMRIRALTRKMMIEADDDDLEEPTKVSADKIDVSVFANAVVRLIDNFDSLLEIRSTLARRAHNFLVKSYEPEVAQQFDDVLRNEHGIVPGSHAGDHEADDFAAPDGDRAGPSPEAPPA